MLIQNTVTPGQFTQECGEWLRAGAPGRPVVISTRARLARNLSGRRFVRGAGLRDRQSMLARDRKSVV